MMSPAMEQGGRAAHVPGESRGQNPIQDSAAAPGCWTRQGQSLAGTYLDQFNEVIELIERLPRAPELMADLLNWHPRSYDEFFAAAAMARRASVADVYALLNRGLRQSFEGVVVDLDRKALGAVVAIRRHYKAHGAARPDIMTDICARAQKHLREALRKATAVVSHAPGGIPAASETQSAA